MACPAGRSTILPLMKVAPLSADSRSTRVPTLLASVQRCSAPSATCPNASTMAAGERSRTGVNETETETRSSPQIWRFTGHVRRRPVSVEPGLVGAYVALSLVIRAASRQMGTAGRSRLSYVCSNEAMRGSDLPPWWPYPAQCPAAHRWGPGLVIVSWTPCECPGALTHPGKGHQTVHCGTPGCTAAWYQPRHRPG